MLTKFLQSSGLNNQFLGAGLNFNEYTRLMLDVISRARLDLTSTNRDQVLAANSPYEWNLSAPHLRLDSTQSKIKNGILLIHGLFDAPFKMMDIGRYFSNKDFLIRGILLPGHGTVPGDLLSVGYQEWIKAVEYGIATLANVVENVYVIAYSLGATLAIYSALNNANIKALILFAPALKSHSRAASYLHLYKLIAWALPSANWYQTHPQTSYVKYQSFACNAGVQTCRLIKLTNALLKQRSIKVPLLTVASSSDETVCTQATIDFFKRQRNPNNHLVVYATKQNNHAAAQFSAYGSDPAIEIRNSYFPVQKILDFSHTCLPISPDNPYYGRNGDYIDFQHYPQERPPLNREIFLGAATAQNLKHYAIQRISYNPDFEQLMKRIEDFLATCTR